MTDKELLEMAAKAAGMESDWVKWAEWNPLTDDGDALRLAVKLGFDVCINKPPVIGDVVTQVVWFIGDKADVLDVVEPHKNDPCAATRRAIVRAAAEIGKGIK